MNPVESESTNTSTIKNKKAWFYEKGSRSSRTSKGSIMSKSERPENRRTLLNPKLLEMVLKTINKRPSIAGEFQQGLAKTATKTWTTHLIQRKKMTKRQKVVEDIASNTGLAKGFRTKFQDEAERLVSILFKEIEKKKPIEEEISTEESSEESSLEEESDESIHSLIEMPEPVEASPPKAPVIKKVTVAPHPHHTPYVTVTTHKRNLYVSDQLAETTKQRAPKTFGLSFINVTKIEVQSSSKPKEEGTDKKKPMERFYTEILRRTDELTTGVRRLPKKQKLKKIDIKKPKVVTSASTGKLEEQPPMKVEPLSGIKDFSKSAARHTVLFKESREKSMDKRSTSDMNSTKSRSTTASWGRSSDSITRSAGSRWRGPSSKQLRKKLEESIGDELDKKTKGYVIKQIKDMLRMLADRRQSSELDFLEKRRRERKSIFVLWKNYMDNKKEENMVEGSVGLKKVKRDKLMEDVEDELSKASARAKAQALQGDTNWKSDYEKMAWRYLYEKAKMIYNDKKRMNDKILANTKQILEEQERKCRTPRDVLVEEERRQNALKEYEACLRPPIDKYSTKRPNVRETTMEEILQMRGFRGRAKNSKNIIWIKKPQFLGYLKPMKKKPKIAYNPPKTKLLKLPNKRKAEDKATVTKSPENISESDFFFNKILIKRTPVIGDNPILEPQPQAPVKVSKPCVEDERAFKKYFGNQRRISNPGRNNDV